MNVEEPGSWGSLRGVAGGASSSIYLSHAGHGRAEFVVDGVGNELSRV